MRMQQHTNSRPLPLGETQEPRFSECGASEAEQFVRLDQQALSALSDADLQAYIQGCAQRFLRAQARWDVTGCFAAIGERDAWWGAEADALRERGCRQQIVEQMELERGLR
jgi:hypothetical protein